MGIRIAIAAVAALSVLAPLQAYAQRGGGQGSGGQNGGLPRGSYAQSCSGASVSSGRLYATCQDMRGRDRATSINASTCIGDLANIDGLLTCDGAQGRYETANGGNNGGGNNGGGWGGNNGGGGNGGGNNGGGNNGGGWGGNNGGGNNNGGGWGGNNGGGWNGGGRGSITVFQDARFGGYSQTFTDDISNLNATALNDAISSVQVRGTWLVCSDRNFQGRCQTVDGDVRDLRSLGLNDEISSMRPVGRNGGRW
ncbi:hypothetical protein BH10PSE2_BH10PSE2_18760 [soil metagenome]